MLVADPSSRWEAIGDTLLPHIQAAIAQPADIDRLPVGDRLAISGASSICGAAIIPTIPDLSLAWPPHAR